MKFFNLLNLAFFLTFSNLCFILSCSEQKKFLSKTISSVSKINPLVQEHFKGFEKGDWFLFDIDDTIFVYADKDEKLVEPEISKFIKELNKKGVVTGGLTFRSKDRFPERLTKNFKLNEISFSLNPGFSPESVAFENGIIFRSSCQKESFFSRIFTSNWFFTKGQALEHFLSELEKNKDPLKRPKRIFFIDDSRKNIHSVFSKCVELEIECLCFHYTKAWQDLKTINPVVWKDKLLQFFPGYYIIVKLLCKMAKDLVMDPIELEKEALNEASRSNLFIDRNKWLDMGFDF